MANARHLQSGYLMEIPLIMVVVSVLVTVLIPALPTMAGKILVAVWAVVWIYGFFYILVTPGWHPQNSPHLHKPWSFLIFVGIVLTICVAAWKFIFYV